MARKIKIFAGPNTYSFHKIYFEEADEILVGCDSGLSYLLDNDMRIDLAVGDFDSLSPDKVQSVYDKAKKIIALPKEKNSTDLAAALDYVYNNMIFDVIEVYGGLGGRIDHMIANLNLMKRYPISFRDDKHLLFVLRKGLHEIVNVHKYISFFALEDVFSLTLQGFKYELQDYYLSTSDSLGVSNEGSGIVDFSKGRLLVVCSNE